MNEDNGLSNVHTPGVPAAAYWLVGIVVALLISMTIGGYLYISADSNREEEAQSIRERQACIAELNSDVLIAFGDAFGTTPSPSVDRAAAVRNIHTTAEILKRADKICTPALDQAAYRRVRAQIEGG